MSYTYYSVLTYDNGDRYWSNKDKQLHREDGPAVEFASGYKAWYINGLYHREDGPAIESASGTRTWYIKGLRHREDGPAIEYPDGDKAWYLNGIHCTQKEFNQKMNPIPSCEGREVEIDGKTYILKEKS